MIMARTTTLVTVIAVACVVVASCSKSTSTSALSDGQSGPQSPVVAAVPARHTGPQGRTAQFIAECTYSHSAPNDPIVHPGHAGRSHQHDFFGNTTTNADSTAASLQSGDTSCAKKSDRASYWAPALIDNGTAVEPVGLVAYYRPAPGMKPESLRPYPAGLKVVAGNPTATNPQPVEISGWACGSSSKLATEPPENCPAGAPLHAVVTFPDCWNGTATDSVDHARHMAASTNGRCPKSHPVPVPQLTLSIAYPITGPGHKFTLASGSIHSGHADFYNGWRPADLQREISTCLHRNQVCGVSSNRAEEAPFMYR